MNIVKTDMLADIIALLSFGGCKDDTIESVSCGDGT
jgi:hypothetical protein